MRIITKRVPVQQFDQRREGPEIDVSFFVDGHRLDVTLLVDDCPSVECLYKWVSGDLTKPPTMRLVFAEHEGSKG